MKNLKLLISTLFFTILTFRTNAQNCELSYSKFAQKIKLNDSLSIAYIEKGTNHKQTILMIHGLGGSMENWENNINELSKKYHCIAIDLPNYGLSSKLNLQAKTDLLGYFSETILLFIQKKKLKNVTLMGHSMGGQIAMITALDKPQIIKKLVLIAPAGLEMFSAAEATMLLNFSTPQFFKSQDEAKIRAGFQANFYKMPESVENMIQDRLKMKNCATFEPYFQMVSQAVKGMLSHPVKESLKNITQKTLIFFGENDALIPNKILHKTLTVNDITAIGKNEILDSKVIMLPQAGHLAMYEQAKLFNESIINYLK